MGWIELLGPSGVGKTTFLSSLQKYRYNEIWVTEKEATAELISKNNFVGFKQNALKIYFKQDYINFNKSYLEDILLSKDKAYENESYRYDNIIKLFFQYIFEEKKISMKLVEREWSEKAYWVCWYKSLVEKLCVFDFYKFDKLIVFDESIIHNNPYINHLNKKAYSDLPKGLIFLSSDVERIYFNLIHRKNNTGENRLHKYIKEESLKDYIGRELGNSLKKLDFAKEFNIPHIELNLNEDFDRNINKANKFLDTLHNGALVSDV